MPTSLRGYFRVLLAFSCFSSAQGLNQGARGQEIAGLRA